MSKVKIIEAQKEKIDRTNRKTLTRLRVAAYCRVSTDSEEQLGSYQSQVAHYRDLIEQNPEWALVDIYADEGISGTKTEKRMDFQRMIADATKGFIDLIITKSISRFARNTMDTLKYVRLLKEHNVAILFEKENINTLTMNGEMLLTILSSLAQQESESLSANVKMGLKMKMKRGELVGFQGCLGYDYDKESKSISINEEEAETVRYIFKRYTEGVGCFVIAKELTAIGAKTKRENIKWNDSTVRGIIKNEKYKGDILMGKTFTVDPITKRRLGNFGEEEKYYIENHHEPIISEEFFEAAQKILNKRSAKSNNKGRMDKFSRKYTFSSKIRCGFCGGGTSRRRWHSGTDHQKDIWQCVTATKKGKKNCPESKGLEEEIIENAFVEAFNMLCMGNKEIVEEFLANVEQSLSSRDNKKQMKKLSAEISKTEVKISKLVDLHLDGSIGKEVYEQKYEELSDVLEKMKAERFDLENTMDEEKTIKVRISAFRKLFESNKPLTVFDPDVFETVIEEVVLGGEEEDGMKNPFMLTFIFKTGLTTHINCTDKAKFRSEKSDEKVCTYQADEARGVCGSDDEMWF